MTDEPNYKEIEPEQDKDPAEYTPTERRAELFNMIEQAQDYRNLEKSQRQLAARYGVSQPCVWKDIQRVREWWRDHLGDGVEVKLDLAAEGARKEYLEAAKDARSDGDHELAAEHLEAAHRIMANQLSVLQDLGAKPKAADKQQLEHSTTDEATDFSIAFMQRDDGDSDSDSDSDSDGGADSSDDDTVETDGADHETEPESESAPSSETDGDGDGDGDDDGGTWVGRDPEET